MRNTSLIFANGWSLNTWHIRVAIGALLVAAITVGFELPYAGIFGVVHISLSGVMARKVFRMVVLFEREMEIRMIDIGAVNMVVGESTIAIR